MSRWSCLLRAACGDNDPATGEVGVAAVERSFTPGNFGSHDVTVRGVDDPVRDGDQLYTVVFHACISSDARYGGFDPRDVTVANRDND